MIINKNKSRFIFYIFLALVFSTLYWLCEVRYRDHSPVDPLPNLPDYLLDLPLPLGLDKLLQNMCAFLHIPTGFLELTIKMISSFCLRIGLLIPAGLFWGLVISDMIPYCSLIKVGNFLKNIGEKKLLIALFLIVLILTSSISSFLYHHEVHIADSVSYLFQAKIFATGKLYAQAPPLKEFFDYGYIAIVNDGGKWYGATFLGHSFMLLWGVLLGIPWAVGSLLVSMSVVLIYLIGKEMYERETGLYAALFAILSPFLLFISATYMSHSSSLFFISLSLFFFVRTVKYGKWFDPLLTGIFLGLEFNIRPLISITLGIPLMVYFLYSFFKTRIIHFRTIVLFVLPCVIFVGIFLFNNYVVTGDFLITPYEKYRPNAHFGFGEDLPHGGYDPIKGLFRNMLNLYNLNETLFGWPGLSLLFVLLFLLSSKNKWDYILFAFLAFTIIAHYFHFAQDTRRWYGTLPALLLLTIKGLKATPTLIERIPFFNRISKERTIFITIIFVFFLFLQSFILYLPSIVKQYRNSFWDADKVLFNSLKEQNIDNALVFMDVSNTIYDLGFSRMSPDLKDKVIFARDLGDKNAMLMQQFPRRKYYQLTFDEIDRKAYLIPLFDSKQSKTLEERQ